MGNDSKSTNTWVCMGECRQFYPWKMYKLVKTVEVNVDYSRNKKFVGMMKYELRGKVMRVSWNKGKDLCLQKARSPTSSAWAQKIRKWALLIGTK